jgi:hypothetical protein
MTETAKTQFERTAFMTRKNKSTLICCVLILLAAALIACGKYINSKNVSTPEQDYARKLTELKADLTKAVIAGREQQASKNAKQTSAGKSPKARPT